MWQEDLPPFLQRDPKKIAHKSLAGFWDLYYTRFVVSTIFIGTLSHFLDWRKLDDSYSEDSTKNENLSSPVGFKLPNRFISLSRGYQCRGMCH